MPNLPLLLTLPGHDLLQVPGSLGLCNGLGRTRGPSRELLLLVHVLLVANMGGLWLVFAPLLRDSFPFGGWLVLLGGGVALKLLLRGLLERELGVHLEWHGEVISKVARQLLCMCLLLLVLLVLLVLLLLLPLLTLVLVLLMQLLLLLELLLL